MTPIRVLIVDDDADTRMMTKMALERAGEGLAFAVVGDAADGEEAIEEARRLTPDLVLMDVEMPGMDGVTATAQIYAELPQVTVVMVSGRGDDETLRRALVAGARDFVRKPFIPDVLVTALRGIAELETRRRDALVLANLHPGEAVAVPDTSSSADSEPLPGELWSFLRATGGAGQTTLVLAFANELATANQRVLVVDLNTPFSHLGILLGLEPGQGVIGPPDDGESVHDAVERMTFEHSSGVRILRPPAKAEDIYRLDAEWLVELTLAARETADFVLVDHPVGPPDSLLSLLDESTYLLPVSHPGVAALSSFGELVNLLLTVGYRHHRFRPLISCVRDNDDHLKLGSDLLETVDIELAGVFPEDPTGIAMAIQAGHPVTRVAPHGPLSRAVREFLIPVLEGRPGRPKTPEQPRGFLERLLG